MDTSSLMEQILSSDNLNRAYLQVVRNKGAEGVDGMKYTELKEHLAKNGEIIKEQLRTRKYKPQPVRRVEIPKPDGGVRNLGVPTVTDRFIQQAIAQVLTPIYEEQFHDHSYGFRPNRCAQQAILTALDMMNEGNDWIVDIDLEKFFDTVNHDKLMTIIGRTIKDGRERDRDPRRRQQRSVTGSTKSPPPMRRTSGIVHIKPHTPFVIRKRTAAKSRAGC